mmetsp:Transcript_79390/g.140125  ORF Transcript_79390/g.140125 Transcript_79390/m.140125 type:complete len:162 (+) Transcript_79390:224-709(+)
MSQYEGHESILIADVDCTAGGESLCQEVGVEGYPTIKYGDPSDLQDYEGERELKALKKFAKTELGPQCSPANLDLCSAEKKKQIEDFLAMPAEGLVESITSKEEELTKASKDHEAFVETLQKQYEESEAKMKEKQKEIKESGLGLMKAVKAYRKNVKKEEL